ncbi:regulatory protein RecX [Microlunatus elymi]|uniref:regulatory protein RecX n=1 Tax=Microlunatus elymi TaxID=2596828 RepID=UPI00143DF3E3|nr:regulatory protein RecX [Microlunatus elymi]
MTDGVNKGPESVEGPGLALDPGARSRDERQQIAAAALAEAEQAVRQPAPRRSARQQEQQQPDPRDVRGRREGVRTRRRKVADTDSDRQPGPEADPESVAREIVLRKLTAQQRSRSELAKALKERDVPDDAADVVLDRMEEVGLVDDAAFAESWVQSRQSRRGLSRKALRHELVRKGVDRDDIDNALATVEPDDELAAATALAEKKLRTMSGLDRQVKYRRLAGALARRGFSPGLTSQVLSSVLGDRADPDT